jgi:hypothetical protein
MGLATGLVFVHPLSAFFATTTVTWDASDCAAGIYTITALARAASNTQHYSVTTSNVSLPKATIVQQFSNLPSGSYQVSATAMGDNGQSFQSQIATITASGASGGDGGVVFGRSRPPSTPATGAARSRNQPADPTPPPRSDPRLTPAAVTTNAPAPDASIRRSDAALEPQVRRLLALQADDSGEAVGQWRRIDVVDEDADGVADYVAVESISGEIWIYRLHGS